MHYHVLCTGGIDSTALMYRLLNAGHDVYGYHIEIKNNPVQMKRETKALKEISKLLSKDFGPKFHGIDSKMYIRVNPQNCAHSSPQLPIWLSALLYLPDYQPGYCDRLAVGCSKTDDPDAVNAVKNSYYAVIKSLKLHKREGSRKNPITPLVFPVVHMSRMSLWNSLPNAYKRHITWCEDKFPEEMGVPNCGAIQHVFKHAKRKHELQYTSECSKCGERQYMCDEQYALLRRTKAYRKKEQKIHSFVNRTYKVNPRGVEAG